MMGKTNQKIDIAVSDMWRYLRTTYTRKEKGEFIVILL